ncbi:MotE family protein [Cochlodiniinecator piscidefendens]|uniref:MotE family protein n=1 Tax=Cochlodiniinecator piscidefendens TaxID=2715756 RepID=UPI00140E4D6E|nr:hypothetical protein [Cochlodiniinecator piscidefendens]
MAKKSSGKKQRSAGRGVLVIISGLFLASGLLRLSDGAGIAIAREVEALANNAEDTPPPLAPALCEGGQDSAELLATLLRREGELQNREAELQERIQALAVSETLLDQNLSNLISAEEALAQTMAQSSTAAEDDISRLTMVYENMKPADAAALFQEMDAEFASGFVGRMNPEAAANIMADLEPQTAYLISIILAGRNALAPTE